MRKVVEKNAMPQMKNVTAFPTSKRERRRLLRRSRDMRLRAVTLLRAMTGWLLAVSVLGFIVINYRLFTPESVQRVSQYAHLGLTAAPGDLGVIDYISGSVQDAGLTGDGLVLADGDTLYVAKPGGLNQLTLQLSYAAPAVCTAGDFILAFDRSGKGVTLANALAPLYQVQMSSPILTGTLSESGFAALVTDEAGYKSAVTVLDEAGTQVYKWSSSEYYVQSAALSPSGRRLCALAFRMENMALESTLLFFELGVEKIAAEVPLGAVLGLETRFLSEGTACAVTDSGAFIASTSGKLTAQHAYTADDLISFSFDRDSVAIATRSYLRTVRSELVLLYANGRKSETLYLTEELQSLSHANGRIGILTAVGLNVFDSSMTALWSDTTAAGAHRVLMQPDGTACVLFNKNAKLLTQHRMEVIDHDVDIPAPESVDSAGEAAPAPVPE